jgi:hypothetical protein
MTSSELDVVRALAETFPSRDDSLVPISMRLVPRWSSMADALAAGRGDCVVVSTGL